MSSSMGRIRLQFALFLATITFVAGQVSSAPVLDDTTALIILSVLLGLSVFICLSLTGCIACVCYYKYRLERGTGDRSQSKEGRWFPFRLRRNRTHCVGYSRNRDNMILKHLTSVDSSNSEGLSTPMFPVTNCPENEDMNTGSESRKDRQPSAVTASKVEIMTPVTEEKIEQLKEVDQSGHQYSATPDPTHKFVKNNNFNLRTRKDSMSYHDIPGSCLEEGLQISSSKSEGCLTTSPPEEKPVKKQSLLDEIAERYRRQRTESTRGLLQSESSDTYDLEGTDSGPNASQGIDHYNELMRTVPQDKHNVTMVKSLAYEWVNTTQDSSHEDLVITPL